ncbi:hypothetical protein GGU11DRAFT_787704, partial [Lentinula aff. detonsa]
TWATALNPDVDFDVVNRNYPKLKGKGKGRRNKKRERVSRLLSFILFYHSFVRSFGCALLMRTYSLLLSRCPVCRAPIPGWDGKGGGVVGLVVQVVVTA